MAQLYLCRAVRRSIAVLQLPVNLRVKVQKRLAHRSVELPDTSLIGGCSGLGGVIHEIVREEFVEDIEVAFALDLFGISADNSFRGFGRSDAVHILPLARAPADQPPRAFLVLRPFGVMSPLASLKYTAASAASICLAYSRTDVN